jgi:hypothetical protein
LYGIVLPCPTSNIPFLPMYVTSIIFQSVLYRFGKANPYSCTLYEK